MSDNDDHTSVDEESNQGRKPRNLEQKRSKAPDAPCHKFYKRVEDNKWGGLFQCNFCSKTFVGRKYDRFHAHISERCPRIPSEVKSEYLEEVKERGIRGAVGSCDNVVAARSMKRKSYATRDVSNHQSDEFSDDDGNFEKSEAVKILTGLLSKVTDEGRSSKKPLSDYTDADFEREAKELQIKEARLRCRELQDRSKFYENFSQQMSTVTKACELFIQEKGQANSVSILQQAYEDTIASPTPTTVTCEKF